jgi:hypothetical protein
LTYMCDPSQQSSISCASLGGCPVGTSCNSNGFCSLTPAASGSQGCSPGLSAISYNGQTYCIDPNVCNVSGSSFQLPNPTCNPGNSNTRCAIRDASALVSAVCNGQQSCSNLSISNFGDYPCTQGFAGQPSSTVSSMAPPAGGCISVYDSNNNPIWTGGARSAGYCSLPYSQGFLGGPPYGSQSNNSDPASANTGYIMHGFYACV